MTTGAAEPALVRISVVIPSLNAERYIGKAVTSAATQDPPPLEIIVQDGGSTDGTLKAIRQLGFNVDMKSEPDRGQAHALNRAIGRATGDLIVWLNADDLIAPGAFAAVADAWSRAPDADFFFGDFDVVDADGSVLRQFHSSRYSPDRVFVHGCYIFSGTMFLRRSLIERVGPFDTKLQTCMDFEFLMRLGDVKAVHAGRTLAQFRMAGDQKTTRMRSQFLRESHGIRWRAANGSIRRRFLTIALGVRDAGYLLTQRMRMTRSWSAIRGTRRL